MAVVMKNRRSQVQVVVNIGTTDSPKSKKINITSWALDPNVVQNDNPEKVLNLGNKVAACQAHPLLEVIGLTRYSLVEEV